MRIVVLRQFKVFKIIILTQLHTISNTLSTVFILLKYIL